MRLTAVVMGEAAPRPTLESLAACPQVRRILVPAAEAAGAAGLAGDARAKLQALPAEPTSGPGLLQVLGAACGEALLFVLPGGTVELEPSGLARLVCVAADSAAGWTYADFRDEQAGALAEHPLIDAQLGSIRDGFDFGSLVLISRAAADAALREHGAPAPELRWGALYDLRLKMSLARLPLRVPEPLYTRRTLDLRASGERVFDYVDPRRRDYQAEMERVATAHLRRLGAWLEPRFRPLPPRSGGFPVTASVVIPVRNRERTIEDAVGSALAQRTRFPFNVIVVDNHSTDRTSALLAARAAGDARLVHVVPRRRDLGIGGCWSEALAQPACGEYAVQLDSDDLYAGEGVLQRVVDAFAAGPCAMVIGSYTVVDFALAPVPPGLVDHREWTRENGRNNALRINGLGAPRAFLVPLLRELGGLPNVSYGEDYAAALRISRDYEIGRIYEPIYFARRWEGNSDAALPLSTSNRYDAYKDHLRSVEIAARQRINRGLAEPAAP